MLTQSQGMAGMAMQSKCILAMISYLRMYASHPLIAQKVLDIVLEPRVVKKLGLIAEEEGAAQTPSGIISQRILSVKNSASLRPKLKGNFSELREKHKMRHKEFHRNKQTEQSSELKTCPSCQELVDEDEPYVVTSCCHLYCTGCFDGLPDQNGRTDTVIRICTSCDKPIKEAACYVKQPEKRKQSKSKRTGYRTQRKRPRGSFKEQVLTKDRQDDEWEEPDENERDWISRIGDGMPSAKLTAIREQVAKWLEEDTEVKIVVFVQYINTIRLLQGICEREDWNFAIVSQEWMDKPLLI